MNPASRTFRNFSLIGYAVFAVLVVEHTIVFSFHWLEIWLDLPTGGEQGIVGLIELILSPIGFILFLALISTFVVSLAGAFYTYFCLVSVPVGALICAWIAHRRRLSVWRYTLLGGLFAGLLSVPWLYLAQSMRGKRFSAETIVNVYTGVYIVWSVALVGMVYGEFFSDRLNGVSPWPYFGSMFEDGRFSWSFGRTIDNLVAPFFLPVLGVPAWIISRALLIRVLSKENAYEGCKIALERTSIRSKAVLLLPFALMFALLFLLVLKMEGTSGDNFLINTVCVYQYYHRCYLAVPAFFSWW